VINPSKPNEDRVVVVAVDESRAPGLSPTITATFNFPHAAGEPLTFAGARLPASFTPTPAIPIPLVPLPGNVGPQPRFDPRANTAPRAAL